MNTHVEVLEFIDNGYTGTNFKRPAVQELLDQVWEGKINCIIVKDFTRFGRNSIEVGYFMEMVFPLYGMEIVVVIIETMNCGCWKCNQEYSACRLLTVGIFVRPSSSKAFFAAWCRSISLSCSALNFLEYPALQYAT